VRKPIGHFNRVASARTIRYNIVGLGKTSRHRNTTNVKMAKLGKLGCTKGSNTVQAALLLIRMTNALSPLILPSMLSKIKKKVAELWENIFSLPWFSLLDRSLVQWPCRTPPKVESIFNSSIRSLRCTDRDPIINVMRNLPGRPLQDSKVVFCVHDLTCET
jgi:hypothetical protein